jgi:hypothetical protein
MPATPAGAAASKFFVLTRSGTVASHHSQFYPASVPTRVKTGNFTAQPFLFRLQIKIM